MGQTSAENYTELVRLVQERTTVEIRDGIEWVTKRIPDLDTVEELDPRVLAINNRPVPTTPENPSIEFLRSMMGFVNIDVTATEIGVTSRAIHGTHGPIPIRIYTPLAGTKLPALVFFHGGGFFGGSLKTVENPCKAIAERANAVVISVDYRLAPEYKFPIGFDDCFDAVKWVYQNAENVRVDREKIGVSGDSAGGNLATVCSIKDRDLGTDMVKFQALIYPVLDLDRKEQTAYTWSRDSYVISRDDQAELIYRGLRMMENFPLPSVYCEPSETTHRYVSPILQSDLSGLPVTLIIAGEYDPLRIENEAYAKKLHRFGNKVKFIQYQGMDHAFIDKIGIYPQAEDCMSEIAKSMTMIFA